MQRVHAAEGEARIVMDKSTGIPEVLFLVPAQYLPLVINKISNIMQLVLPRLSILTCFHYCPGHYTYLELFCQLLILVQIIVPLPAKGEELRIFGHPVCEMILGKDGELGAF